MKKYLWRTLRLTLLLTGLFWVYSLFAPAQTNVFTAWTQQRNFLNWGSEKTLIVDDLSSVDNDDELTTIEIPAIETPEIDENLHIDSDNDQIIAIVDTTSSDDNASEEISEDKQQNNEDSTAENETHTEIDADIVIDNIDIDPETETDVEVEPLPVGNAFVPVLNTRVSKSFASKEALVEPEISEEAFDTLFEDIEHTEDDDQDNDETSEEEETTSDEIESLDENEAVENQTDTTENIIEEAAEEDLEIDDFGILFDALDVDIIDNDEVENSEVEVEVEVDADADADADETSDSNNGINLNFINSVTIE